MPEAIIASVHAPVRPWVEQGSSVTYIVAPGRGVFPRASNASRSACGPPSGAVAPSPTIWPSSTITAPTIGLGCVVPQTLYASSRARRMNGSCSASDIGVVLFFVADRRLRAVTRVHCRVPGQRVNLVANRFRQHLETSARQIRSSNAAVEERVANKCRLKRREVEEDI